MGGSNWPSGEGRVGMRDVARRGTVVVALVAGLAGLWGCESQEQKQKITQLSDQVRQLEQTNAALKGQVDTLTAETRELRDKLAAAEAKAAPAKKK